jgi:hypothetical protein
MAVIPGRAEGREPGISCHELLPTRFRVRGRLPAPRNDELEDYPLAVLLSAASRSTIGLAGSASGASTVK